MKKVLAITLIVAVALLFCVSCSKKTTTTASAEPAKAAAPETITIAFIGNTTGDYAMYGVPVRNSVVMFFEQLNAAGGINGKQVKLLEYDDKADGTESINAYNLAKRL